LHLQDEAAKDKVMKALADEYSRAILVSTMQTPKSAIEVSADRNIPISTAYRRLHELEEAGLVVVERSKVTEDGKRFELYRSTVRSVAVSFNLGSIDVELLPNEDMVTRFTRLWGYMRGQTQ
jgi:DNA-binding transcriptional ArsR family regulator